MLINITGGKDLTLFEVDQTVQKVRAEVDPEAELIFEQLKIIIWMERSEYQ